MSPRPTPLLLSALALVCCLGAAPARAGALPTDDPLVRLMLGRPRAGAPATAAAVNATTPADPFRSLPTALPGLRGTVTRSAPAAPAPFRGPGFAGSGSAGKLPAAEGILGDNFGASLTTFGDMFGDGVSDVAVGAPYG